jgi:hypothetical protein
MGSVLRAMDAKLRRELALKVTTVPRNELPIALLARFIEEAQITAQLEHPNIVPIHDLGVDPEGHAYFSMKLVRGQSLETIIEKRKARDPDTLAEFGLRRLLDVFLQVCQAVAYAHARGVIHRDLKPANVMVGDFGEVLVMDWGVAKLKGRAEPASAERSSAEPQAGGAAPSEASEVIRSVRDSSSVFATQHGALLGTPAYMAPEQAMGLEVDERADIYSLGVILYEILCGEVPFDSDDPGVVFSRLFNEAPRPPAKLDPTTPLALEMLALRLLEKDPKARDLSLPQIRSQVQDYIDGIGREYRRDTLWTNLLWLVGALGLFAFLVPYLTGQSVAAVIALTPSTVFNAVGWLLLVMALRYPLWSAASSLRLARGETDRFRRSTTDELFVSGYLAHRTLATTITPLFLVVFVIDAFAMAWPHASRGGMQPELVERIVAQLRAEWAHALTSILLFVFGYLFFLSTEARFARRVDRYVHLVRRARWESVWPFVLIGIVVSTVIAMDVVDWIPSGHATPWMFLRERVLTKRFESFEIGKTLVFQATFLFALVATNLVIAFPVPELLASFRMAYQPVEAAWVSTRRQYFLRSMAVFQVARASWLYGGTVMGSLNGLIILTHGHQGPLATQLLYILGPSVIGFLGFALIRRYVMNHLANAPAVQSMLAQQIALARDERAQAILAQLRAVSWRTRLSQVGVPVVCILGYLIFSGSGLHEHAIRQLIVPTSIKGWLLILPYALLAPIVFVRDFVQIWLLHRRTAAPAPR